MWLFSYAERRPRRTVTKRQAPQKRRCSGVLEAHVLEAHVAPSTDLQLEKLGLLRTVRLSLCTGHRGEVPSKPLRPSYAPPLDTPLEASVRAAFSFSPQRVPSRHLPLVF